MTKIQRKRRPQAEIDGEKAKIQAKRELEAKLQIVRYVSTGDMRFTWSKAEALRAAVKNGILSVAQTHSNCRYKPGSLLHEPYPWDDKETHSTYNGCHDFVIQWNANDVNGASIKFTIWDGDNFSGERTVARVTFILVGDWARVQFVREAVEREFCLHCLRAYDEELERQRQSGAEAMGRAMLRSLANRNDVTVDEYYRASEAQDEEAKD